MPFLDNSYLLSNLTSIKLFETVKTLPVLDPHNHADVKEIYENKNFTDIWHVECSTDHYVWEVLRKRGVDEKYITGDADNYEKWIKLTEVFDTIIANPVYEWIHLDLRRRLGIDEEINKANGHIIWEKAKEILAKDEMRPQNLLKNMNVETMCTTDDPIDTLKFHKKLSQDPNLKVTIRPSFRPDKAMNIFQATWLDYIHSLEKCVKRKFKSIDNLVDALQERHDFFAENACLASDHGVQVPYAYNVSKKEANSIFKSAMKSEKLSSKQIIAYSSYMLNKFAEMDMKKAWVFQLHIGAVRDIRKSLFEDLGYDCGGDISDHKIDIVKPLKDLLNNFDDSLNIVLYCLEPSHMATLATISRAFGKKVSLGSAWWLNDTPIGMKRQLEYIASVDILSNFAGMVSDSRKILSYGSRNEMFRRVLCDVIGTMIERGQFSYQLGERLVKYLAYQRPKELFGF